MKIYLPFLILYFTGANQLINQISLEITSSSLIIQGWVSNTGIGLGECNGQSILGAFIFGQNTVVQKIYTNLPDHFRLRYSFTFWKIDSWDHRENESVDVYFDDDFYKKYIFGSSDGTQMCGQMMDGWNELSIDEIYENDHNMPTFTVKFVGHFDEQPINESFGISNIKLELFQCPVECGACNFVI